MIRLPLTFCSTPVGFAQADDDLEPLRDTVTLCCAMPRSIYTTAKGRPDIVLAMLKQDESLLPRVHPFFSLFKTQIRLAHVAIRPELVPLIIEHTTVVLPTINRIRFSIARICYANGNRTDCRRENLRELTSRVK